MNKLTNTRIIFDKGFYTLQAVLNSNKFNRLRKNFYNKLDQLGIPMPEQGFKTASEYHEWGKRAHKKGVDYNVMIDKMLGEFTLEDDLDQYRLGAQWYLFFGKKKAPITFTHGRFMEPSENKKSLKISLTIYPWTKKEDALEDLWPEIEREQKKLVGYQDKKRNREWNTFLRDLIIYELFLKIKKQSKIKKQRSTSVYRDLVEHPKFKQIVKTFKASDNIDFAVGSIITRCRRVLGKIDLV